MRTISFLTKWNKLLELLSKRGILIEFGGTNSKSIDLFLKKNTCYILLICHFLLVLRPVETSVARVTQCFDLRKELSGKKKGFLKTVLLKYMQKFSLKVLLISLWQLVVIHLYFKSTTFQKSTTACIFACRKF